MSSLYVRSMARGWCSDIDMTLPFLDTVNTEADPPGPMWSTLVFVSANNTVTNYCGGMEETGTFDFIALGTAGLGDVELFTAAEHDVALLMQRADPSGRLTLLHASPPEDFLQAGSAPWYTVSMVISYSYQHPVAADDDTLMKGTNHDPATA